MSGGGSTSSVLPVMGAVVGAAAGITGGPVGMMAGAQLGASLGGGLGNAIGGDSSQGGQALLGSPQQTVSADSGSDEGNPFAQYGTSQLPSDVQAMSLPEGTGKEAPGAAAKAAGLTGSDMAGYATTAMQAINAAQAAQQTREANEATIWKARNPLAGVVVQNPGMGNVATQMGQFPTVGQGFGKY